MRVQVAPSYSHVSPRSPDSQPSPPKRTIRPRVESYAMVGKKRAEGDVVNDLNIQSVPSHSHVDELALEEVCPPNMTERLRFESNAIAVPSIAGGKLAGARRTQLAPSNSQVSPRSENAALPPPKRTVRLRRDSNVMLA